LSVEGSGWAVLTILPDTKKLMVMQVEKHNNNVFPCLPALLALDVFEHAYYLDYQNDRAKFIEAFWGIVDWERAETRYNNAI
jgi:Fe-Mn family superoxide dismutase